MHHRLIDRQCGLVLTVKEAQGLSAGQVILVNMISDSDAPTHKLWRLVLNLVEQNNLGDDPEVWMYLIHNIIS
jgi:hypothetical protein